jgi:alkylhydroperoxidase family enzyme
MAHSKVLRDRFFDADGVRDLVVDRKAAGLDELDLAVMDFAEQVAADAAAITSEDVDRLRQLGLSDVEVLDVALTAAARCFFAKVLDAMGALPDSKFREWLEPELQQTLTVGRPVAES